MNKRFRVCFAYREIAGAQPFHKALHAGGIRPGRSEGTAPEDAQGRRRGQPTTIVADEARHRYAAQVGYALFYCYRVIYQKPETRRERKTFFSEGFRVDEINTLSKSKFYSGRRDELVFFSPPRGGNRRDKRQISNRLTDTYFFFS